MNIETIESFARRIEEAGLKRHQIEDESLHHYVVELNYKKEDEDEIMDNLPEAFESVCENECKGMCDGTFMFYLEDQNEELLEAVIEWLKTSKVWSNADVPEYVK